MAAMQVVPGVHMVSRKGTNLYLIEAPEPGAPNRLALIDAGYPGTEGDVLAAVAALGRQPSDLKDIVLTHAHPDHVGSAAAIVAATGARTWMHALDRPIAERGAGFRPLTPARGLLLRAIFALFVDLTVKVPPVRIDAEVADGDVIPVAGGLRAVHVPGHCLGQVALLWEGRGVLFAGDACGNLFGLGDPLGWEDEALGHESQRRLARLDFAAACFGHGRPLTENASARFRKAFP